jgi:hypothetical protein
VRFLLICLVIVFAVPLIGGLCAVLLKIIIE